MVGDLRLARVLWAATAILAFLAALGGVISKSIYVGLVPEEFLPGAFPQDVVTIVVSILLLGLTIRMERDHVKRQVVVMGLLGSLFYLYGVFTIERVYNWLYLLYASTFALSFWSIVASLAGFNAARFDHLRVRSSVLRITASTAFVIAAAFTILWVAALVPLMRDNNRIDFLYSIYILDLCFVMPAFLITAAMSLRRMPLGILLLPAVMILGFFVIFPLGLNELAKPSAGMAIDYGAVAVSFAFAFFMLSMAALQLSGMRLEQIEFRHDQ